MIVLTPRRAEVAPTGPGAVHCAAGRLGRVGSAL
jgi:hypothetical protein